MMPRRYLLAVSVTFALFAFTLVVPAQEFPKKIRGYKVHIAKVNVDGGAESQEADGLDAAVTVSTPTVVDVGLSGVTVDVDGTFIALAQSGTVDFLTFNDLSVNGISVEADEYRQSFSFSKDQRIKLPAPIRLKVGTFNLAKAAYREFVSSKDQWKITGTVFVFGRFRKFGMTFKRVVPIKISMLIPNPIPAALRK